jgi:hypothetical protein
MVIDRFLRMFLVVLGLICISLPASAQPAPDLERRERLQSIHRRFCLAAILALCKKIL